VHPLAELITGAAQGRFPASDGGWQRVTPWRPELEAVVSFTGHAVLAVGDDVTDPELAALGVDGFGGAHHPRVLTALAGPDGWIESLDLIMVGRGTGPKRPVPGGKLILRPDLADHPRAQYAVGLRSEVTVLGYAAAERSAVVITAQGLAGLRELSFELEPDRRSSSSGATLIRDAVSTVPAGEIVVAQVAPGNAQSLRSLLGAGFVPVGSSQLYRPARNS
jgi:hypothetical protein